MKQLQVRQRNWAAIVPLLVVVISSQGNFLQAQEKRRTEAMTRAVSTWAERDRVICEELAKRLPEATRKQIYADLYRALAKEFDIGINRTDIPSDGGETLYQIYEAPVAKKYAITREEMRAIGTEGDLRRWPNPWDHTFFWQILDERS